MNRLHHSHAKVFPTCHWCQGIPQDTGWVLQMLGGLTEPLGSQQAQVQAALLCCPGPVLGFPGALQPVMIISESLHMGTKLHLERTCVGHYCKAP